MKQKILIFILIFVLIVNVFVSIGSCEETNNSIFYVGGTGNGNYSTIQEAVDLAFSGDTIFVYSGTYYETLIINKSINLEGQNWYNTIIDGGDNVYAVLINSSGVSISGFTIQNSVFGLFISGSNILSRNTIQSNIIKDNNNAIYLQRLSYENTISKNIIVNNGEGIHLYNSSNNRIVSNTIEYHATSGILLWEASYNNTISGNNITYNSRGILLERWSNNNVILKNNITNNDRTGISLGYSFHNIIQNNSISYNDQGICFVSSNKNNISGNLIENNTIYGVYLSNSDNNLISKNNYFLNNGQDIGEKSPPPKIKIPGFELILIFVAIWLVFLIKRKQ